MRLKRLDLKAYGPFTKRAPLEFNSKVPGLHIIFGANEAGKSSSLRALKAFLYGFDQQTPDNFLHNYDQLLVGGCLENSQGEEIVFQRRKKRINDVIDEAGEPIDPAVLAPFLNGVEQALFESLYGINHDTLVRGGEEILAQKGEVGQALFSAGSGISSLRKVIVLLEQEAAALFKPAGHLPEINQAIKKFREQKKRLKEVSLSSGEWKEHRKNLKNAETDRAVLEKERDQHTRELQRLDRLAKAVPLLASLKSLEQQQTDLGEIIPLPPDFNQRYEQARLETDQAGRQLKKDANRLEKLEEKRRTILFNKDILNQAEKVDDFHQRLGEYRKTRKDIPLRDGMRISLRREAAALLKQVRPDLDLKLVETLRPVISKKKTIQALSSQYEAVSQQLRSAEHKVETAKKEITELKKIVIKVPEIIVSPGLIQAVKSAQKAGDIDEQLEKIKTDVELNKKDCLSELRRIGLWSGDLEALMELSFPFSETVRQFEKNYDEIDEKRRELQKELETAEKELNHSRIEIKKLEYAGDVPSEEDLILVREKREQGWQLLLREWLHHEDITKEGKSYDPDRLLPDAYERYVDMADTLADRLRREADRVASAAAFKAGEEAIKQMIAQKKKEASALAFKEEQLHQSWLSAWQPSNIVPLPPKEMSGWMAKIENLRFKVGDVFKREQEIKTGEQRRKELNQALKKELESIGVKGIPAVEELGPVLIFAQAVQEQAAEQQAALEKFKEKQEQRQKTYSQAKEDLNIAREAFTRWQEQWQKAFLDLGLKDEVSTIEAIDLVENLQNCFDKLKEADDFKKRIDGMKRDAARLEAAVIDLLKIVAPGMVDLPLDQVILNLKTMLGQAEKDSALYDKLSEEMEVLQEDISATRKTLQAAKDQMDELVRTAQCEKPEDLPAVIIKFTEHQRLQEKISDVRTVLAGIGAGVTLEEMAGQASEVDVDELPGRMDSLKKDINERINPEINRISQIIGEENRELFAMDGNAKAAQIAEEMEQELTAMRRLAEKYSLLKLSARILQQEIERYREEHQDPVLKIASRYFNKLTMGSFSGMRADVDDKGGPVLVGVRPDKSRLTVEKMSSGTRDQLFLALRLATLEWRLETNEPMPFIVDDILINFDDDRSKATIRVLADLSKKNQVILFTHHKQIAEEARIMGKNDLIQVHEL